MKFWWDQALTPAFSRVVNDPAEVLLRFEGVHCFDLTMEPEIFEQTICAIESGAGIDADKLYLPAQRTWIEVIGRDPRPASSGENVRAAIFVEAVSSDPVSGVSMTWVGSGASVRPVPLPSLGLRGATLIEITASQPEKIKASPLISFAAALMMINTPQLFNRQRRPFPQQQVRQVLRLNRPYPLLAWTEVKIDPQPQTPKSGRRGGSTGLRPLHWCKAHRRRICGVWTNVSAHWRGDPALGIKRSRHVVKRRGR